MTEHPEPTSDHSEESLGPDWVDDRMMSRWSRSVAAFIAKHRESILWWIGVPLLYRIGCYVPIPLFNLEGLNGLFSSIDGGVKGGYLLPRGGVPLSILAVGIAPYVYASVGVQAVVLLWRRLASAAEARQWSLGATGGLALAICAIQARRAVDRWEAGRALFGTDLIVGPDWLFGVTTWLTLIAATAICIWVSDHVTRKGVTNGMFLFAAAAGLSDLLGGRFQPRVLVLLIAALIAAPGYRRAVLASRPSQELPVA